MKKTGIVVVAIFCILLGILYLGKPRTYTHNELTNMEPNVLYQIFIDNGLKKETVDIFNQAHDGKEKAAIFFKEHFELFISGTPAISEKSHHDMIQEVTQIYQKLTNKTITK